MEAVVAQIPRRLIYLQRYREVRESHTGSSSLIAQVFRFVDLYIVSPLITCTLQRLSWAPLFLVLLLLLVCLLVQQQQQQQRRYRIGSTTFSVVIHRSAALHSFVLPLVYRPPRRLSPANLTIFCALFHRL